MLPKEIIELSDILGFSIQDQSDGIFQIWHENTYTFIELKNTYEYLLSHENIDKFDITDIDKNEYLVSIKFRFRDWHVPYGDRTDFNDIASMIVAIFFRLFFNKISFKIIDIANVFSGIEQELYAREILPIQPYIPFLKLNKKEDIEYFKEIIFSWTYIIGNLCSVFN